MSNFQRKLLGLLLLMCGTVFSFAQTRYFDLDPPKVNSPYSRIGLGNLTNNNFSHARGMGSLSAAYNDLFRINISNPASYAFLGTAVFDVGINAKRTNLSAPGSESQVLYTGNLDYIALAFPTKNPINRAANPIKSPWYWGMNFAFLNNSDVGYRVEDIQKTESDSINYYYQGTGGTFKVLWGNAVRYNNISVGLNFGYLFGEISSTERIEFLNRQNTYFSDLSDVFSLGNIIWNAGVQYRHQFKSMDDGELKPNGKTLTFGAYGNSGNNVDFTTSQLYRRVNRYYGGIDTPNSTDTLVFNENVTLPGKLPSEFGVGLYYKVANKYGLGVDFKTTSWSDFLNPIRPTEQLSNSWRFAVGGNITPDYRSIRSYWQKINYQAGFYFSKDPRGFDNTLTDYGVTFGLGLPVINRQLETSFINFAFEIGQLTQTDSIKETYAKLTVGFTLNNNKWFLKRKFY